MIRRPATPALEVRGLTKRFGDHVAVDDVSFSVPYGAVTGFVGGNGSGKTTTMRMLLGLSIPTAGVAHIAGRPIAEHPAPRQLVGATLDRPGVHPGMTGRRHLALLAQAIGIADPARIDETLQQVGLTDAAGRRVRGYSTGMRQRLALGAALLTAPPILILDEPSSGLDPGGIHWLRGVLTAQASAGHAVFISTHQLAELATIVEHLVVIDQGRLIATGPTDQVLATAGATTIEQLLLEGAPS